jgi:hypothetical protein
VLQAVHAYSCLRCSECHIRETGGLRSQQGADTRAWAEAD